ncbi:MAG: universal stress protein [Syntrophobacteria bacterium]|jgi:nucleotide-binding universal stress UspA family protein|nr:universal stress protein [Deltaproteobacteria bacterium]
MQNKKNILIAMDGSRHSLDAARYVAQTCNPSSLRVNLMHVMPTAPETFWDLEKDAHFQEKIQTNYTEWKKNTEETAQRFLNDARNVLIEEGVRENEVGVILREREVGIARDIIAESVRDYDAVVVGRRGLSKLADLFLGSVANKIVEVMKDTSVWVVGDNINSKRILLAVDASENTVKAVDYVGNVATASDAEVTLFHVVRRFGFLDNPTLRDHEVEGFWEEVKKDIPRMVGLYKERLAKVGVKGSRISTQVNLHSSSRAKDILTEAREGEYGTIVMGRRGLSKVREFLMGRVTSKVLHRAEGFAVWIVP